MFYSQTFLARKGPLSTVWIAAHLQHRLKKSQYTSTDISFTVQHIMDPGVPIALRMSAYLLLGVVRIYSKKVDYLLLDCNAVRSCLYKQFGCASNTEPEDARQAPIGTITMPETFDLSAVNLDFETDHNGDEDFHQRSLEEITLRDRNPYATDNYVTISFDEDIIFESSHIEAPPNNEASPMEEDIIPQSPLTNIVGDQDGGPSVQIAIDESPPQGTMEALHDAHNLSENPPDLCNNNTEPTRGLDETKNENDPNRDIDQTVIENKHIPKTTDPPEILRGAKKDHILIQNPPFLGNNNTEPSRGLDETVNEKDPNRDINQTMIEKDHISETADEPVFASFQQHFGPPTPVTSQGDATDPQVSGGHDSFHLATSPPIQQPQRRGRKRKQFFDEPIVVTNRFMRGALNNPCDILRQRRDVPCSTLGTWKLNNSRIKEHIFYQPLLTGFCKDLLDISQREYICSKPCLVISEEDHVDAVVTITPPTYQIPEEPRAATPPITAPEIEIPRHRSIPVTAPPTIPDQDVGIEINIEGDYRSPNRREDHVSPTSVETVPAPYVATSPGAHGSEIETPSTCWDYTIPDPDTHQLINSAEKEELDFLLVENNTPAGSQGTSKSIGTLSERTRGVAQYLKRHSPITPILEDPAGDLSLNNILEGKTRKISARMFFEVLVLKTHGLIDVKQEEYGDVTLTLTPMLSDDQI